MAANVNRFQFRKFQLALTFAETDNEEIASSEFWIEVAYGRLDEDENALPHFETAYNLSYEPYYKDMVEIYRRALDR